MKAKHYILCRGGGGGWRGYFVFCYCFFFVVVVVVVFQFSGQLAFVKMYNFLQVMVLLKNAVCSNGICWNEEKFLFLEEGSPEKDELCECHGGGVEVDLIGGGSREKFCPGEYPVLYSGKIRLKPRLFLPAILAGN